LRCRGEHIADMVVVLHFLPCLGMEGGGEEEEREEKEGFHEDCLFKNLMFDFSYYIQLFAFGILRSPSPLIWNFLYDHFSNVIFVYLNNTIPSFLEM